MDTLSRESDAAPLSPLESRIVVALPPDEHGSAALAWALEHPGGRTLRLLTIDSARRPTPRIEPDTSGLSAESANRVAEAPHWTAVAPPLAPAVAEALTRMLRPDDLLVLGADVATGWQSWVDGTLPLRVAATADCPVVLVPHRHAASRGPVALLVGEEEESDALLAFAGREAEQRDVGLLIVHAWEVAPLFPVQLAKESAAYAWDREQAQSLLDSHLRRLGALVPAVRVMGRLLEGPPVATLLPVLEQAALAVVARRGRGSVQDFARGSVRHELLERLPCAIAVVPV